MIRKEKSVIGNLKRAREVAYPGRASNLLGGSGKSAYIALIVTFFLLSTVSSGRGQSFREISGLIGVNSFCLDPSLMGGGVAFFDYNQGRYPDLNGDGTFSDISEKAGVKERAWSTSASFGDFNLDGLLDIYVANYAILKEDPFQQHANECAPNFLYQNRGNNQFENVAYLSGTADVGCGLAVAFTDCDNDRDVDLYVANDFGLQFEPNELYINPYPESPFRKTAPYSPIRARINAMGVAVGDYNEDGDFDYYVTNMGDNPFFENRNKGALFQDVAAQKGVNNPDGTSWGAAFLDYNNDTYLDLTVANGQVVETNRQNNENRLFKADQYRLFQDVSKSAGIASTKNCRGLSFADMDKDGDLDFMFGLVSADEQSEENTLVYQNNEAGLGNWLKVKLRGVENNRNGYGAQISLIIGNRRLIREADGGSSYLSHHYNEIHFGLGDYTKVDSLIVDWPGGNRDVFSDIAANQAIEVVEMSHWYPYRNREISIFKGESVFLAGSPQTEAGVYQHRITGSDGLDSMLIITRLKVLESPAVGLQDIAFAAFPNPFRASARIRYTLPENSRVRLSVFEAGGKQGRVLIEEEQAAGEHYFSFEDQHAFYGRGLYIFRLSVDRQVYVLKLVKL